MTENLDRATVDQLSQKLGPSAELFDFAQSILNDGHSEDLDAVQSALNSASEQFPPALPPMIRSSVRRKPAALPPLIARRPSSTSVSRSKRYARISPWSQSHIRMHRLLAARSRERDYAVDYDSADPQRTPCMALLLAAWEDGASDLVCADSRIFIRKNRAIEYKSEEISSAAASEHLNLSLLTEQEKTDFLQHGEYDFALPLDSGQRFRVNLMKHRDGIAGTYRIVPTTAPSLEALGFPNADRIKELLAFHNGLVLVTGPVGAGKTRHFRLVSILNQARRPRHYGRRAN